MATQDNLTRRISEVVESYAPEGANDARWALMEHQVIQAKISLETAESVLRRIAYYPESEMEKAYAEECACIVSKARVAVLAEYATLRSYLAISGVWDRVGRREE